ncbi:hypothetical protein BG846_02876 [Streptomyces fradiae ATCC 10745 = DSM 40063]|uniref:Uncharacterized protein n=1 Tax=Streptomyces fradiae ATCC 10745 = DSM 40063 TaxID=1319510 RepID=A0A1Y2NVE9_STRFR|nr:hypothetical protein BG846_02876 [Streptomyces fradiae ATCC 10745 = DSM 40063]
MMKHSSSTMDSSEYAVCRSCGRPRRISAHRARVIAPRLGTHPAAAALTNSVQSGSPACAHSTSAPAAAADTSAAGRSTRRCPYRSTSRDT